MSAQEGLSEAKQVLLGALEAIGGIEEELGAEVKHVAVVYSVYGEKEDGSIESSGGWYHSVAPGWLIAALLREQADALERVVAEE